MIAYYGINFGSLNDTNFILKTKDNENMIISTQHQHTSNLKQEDIKKFHAVILFHRTNPP